MIDRWLSRLTAREGRVYWITYGVAFVVMFAAMSASFFLKGHDFIWVDDGLTQQYTVFVDLGAWIRELLFNVFVAHTFAVPMWSTELGYGQDSILWLSGALGDPINWIAVFSTPETAQFLLNLTVPITLLLAGIAYSKLCFYHDRDGFATLLGAMTFLFSGVTLIAFTQIFMVYPLLLAPLVVLGVDKVLDDASPVLFVVACALSALYSFTNTWMMCLLLFIYCVVRYAFMPQKSAKRFCTLFVKVFLLLMLGIAIGAVLFVPYVVGVLSLDRVGLERSWNLLYSLSFYIQLFVGFLKFDYAGSECYLGVLALSAVAIIALFASKKDVTGKMLIVLFVIFSAILLLPVLGRIMNGFAYPNNRWVWAYALLIGYITTYMVPRLLSTSNASKRTLVIGMAVGLVVFMVFGMFARKSYYLVLILLVLTACCIYALRGHWQKLSMMLSVLLSCALLFTLWGRDMAARNVPLGQAQAMATEGTNAFAATLPGDGWRYDALGGAMTWRNSSTVVDEDSTTFYNSVYNGAIDDYHSQLGLTSSALNFSVDSLASRAILEQFAGVGYVIVPEGQEEIASGIYDEEVASEEGGGTRAPLVALSSEVALPLAFFQDKTLAESAFREMGPVEAQEALLDHAVIENGSKDVPAENTLSERLGFSYGLQIWEEVPAVGDAAQKQPADLQVVESSEGSVEAGQATQMQFDTTGRATMHVDVDVPAGTEAYVVMEDVAFEPSHIPTSRYSTLEKLAVKLKGIFPLVDEGCSISVTAEDRSAGVWQSGSDAHLYSGKDTWAFCLGSATYDRHGIDIAFESAGSYDIQSLSVQIEDESKVEAQLASLQERGAKDIRFADGQLSCQADAVRDGEVLIVRLPYSAGWSAWVDGKEAPVLNADLGFIGLELGAGAHDIVLRYETPGLKIGALLSCIGIAAFVALVIVRRKMVKNPRKG